MDSTINHQNHGRSTSPINAIPTSNAHPSDSDDASRDSRLRPAIEDGEIIPGLEANEVIENDNSPKAIIPSDLHEMAEPTSSLMDAQPDSADEDWDRIIPALIPQPLKIENQTDQEQGQHLNNMPTNLTDAAQAFEPASHPARNAFSDTDLETAENLTNDPADMASETQPLQDLSTAQLGATQGTSSQDEDPIPDISDVTNAVPQNLQTIAQKPLQLRGLQEELFPRFVSEQAGLVDGSMSWEKVDHSEQASTIEDADKVDSVEAIDGEDTSLGIPTDDEALVAGLARLQIDTSGSDAVTPETDVNPITTKEESSDDPMNEHDGTVQDGCKEYHRPFTNEDTPSETFVVGEEIDEEELLPQPQAEHVEAIAEAKNDNKEYHQSPADKSSSSNSPQDEAEVDAEESLPQHHSEHMRVIAGAKDDNKEYHQYAADNDLFSNSSYDEGEIDAEESHPQRHTEHTEAIAVTKDDSKESHQSPADNNLSLDTPTSEAEPDAAEPLPQHHPIDTEALPAATAADSEDPPQSPPNNPNPAPTPEPDRDEEDASQSSLGVNTSDPESTTSHQPSDIPITTGTTNPIATTPEETGDQAEVLEPPPGNTDRSAPTSEIPHDLSQGTDTATQAPETTTAIGAVITTETSLIYEAGKDTDPETEKSADAEPGTKGRKTGWMERFRRLRFFAG
ncbi:MAG: hypothetical protein HETSPECPRED_001286 [Heterodermia speciosa]|uniref:Uncharacterized protein n=1 Tax=Heterodermia speciosa TaxID=116794 RepID=A0A8H3EWD3_9LECA|nr:MAG: hypothetical protein HETSPECPRED_001286 [Heterodermia speciosa]